MGTSLLQRDLLLLEKSEKVSQLVSATGCGAVSCDFHPGTCYKSAP